MGAKAGNKGKSRGRPRKNNIPQGQGQPKQPSQKTQGKDLLFILDIGTRSVIGVAGRVEGPLLKVLKVDAQEHSERAVVDGQIENIEQTARIAGQVKSRMEQALGLTLTEVHVAAAGRVLKTEHVVCQMELDDQRPIGAKELAALDKLKGPALARQRYEMFRAMGQGLPPAGREEP